MTRLPFDPKKTAAARALREDDDAPLLASASSARPAEFGNLPVRTVKQINAMVQHTLATHLPAVFLVQGEISNFRTYDRGHAFFTLKEPGAEIPCILWKDGLERLKFRPKDGMAVIARGSVKMYEPQGKVQLYVETLFAQGTGGLEIAFRQLCEKLKAEGLFEQARKRRIPQLPQRVAIITSRTGDVLHDVLTTAYRRYAGLHTLLFPVRVQGDEAPRDIVRAIEAANAYTMPPASPGGQPLNIDLILLVRGGGSLEDLWAFNDEMVARAMIASEIPIATGIGHEPDTTIADLVGDLRGPTPTGVTELTIPDAKGLRRDIDSHASILTRDMKRHLNSAEADLQHTQLQLHAAADNHLRVRTAAVDRFARLIAQIEPRHAIAQGWRRVEESSRGLQTVQQQRLTYARERLRRLEFRLQKISPLVRVQRYADRLRHLDNSLTLVVQRRFAQEKALIDARAKQLHAVSPQAVLARGYSITMDAAGKIIRSQNGVAIGDQITTQLADGQIKSTVGTPRQGKLF
jgi:exodeoxyribonuclease VII large subunit